MSIHKSICTGVYVDNHQEFICDERSDILLLPTQITTKDKCPTGSKAFVIDDCSKWILNSKGVWKEIIIENSSSIDGEINIATDSEINSMLDDVFSN